MSNQIGKNQARFSFEDIRTATGAKGQGDGQIEGVTTDSRQLEAGNLFVALRGEKFDGHDYMSAAQERGVATLGETANADFQVEDSLIALGDLARFHCQRFDIPVVGVTGSYGKTTTRALIYAALSAKFNTLTSQGNFNNEIGLPLTLFQMEAGHQAAILEMGMRGRGQIDYLAKVALPTVGVITNIGPQHIELLGSEENIAAAKAELLKNLPPDGLAVVPADSPFIEFLKAKAPCRIVAFGTSATADYRAQNIQTNPDGTIGFSINSVELNLPLPGAHNAVNAAAAFAVALELGVEAQAAARALENVEIPGARMRVVKTESGLTLIDDCYNAGPDSMRAALQTLLDFPGSGRRVAILGSMKELGEHSEAQHQKIGAFAGQFCEMVVGVGGDTRPLLNAALAAARQVENEIQVSYCETAQEAAERVREWVQLGDVVLVKGSRSVGLEVVVDALRGLGY